MTLTLEEREAYRRALVSRAGSTHKGWEARRERAWALAQQAADLLRAQFGASRIAVFGSIVHKGCFTPWSDVDLAAWGLKPEDTFRALGAVQDLSSEIQLNLVDIDTCAPGLRSVIETESIEV